MKNGFTLVELVCVMAALAIVFSFALPSFNDFRLRIEADHERTKWVRFLESARHTANTEQTDITVCAVINNQCDFNFSQQWVYFSDTNNNRVVDGDEVVIRTLTPRNGSRIRLYRSGSSFLRYLYQPGLAYSGPTASISVCQNGQPDVYAFHIRLNIMGRLAFAERRAENGLVMFQRNSRWQQITC